MGASLFTAWVYCVCIGVHSAYKNGHLEFSLLLLLMSLGLAFAIVSMVQYRSSESGQFFVMFVGALAIAKMPIFKETR